MEGWGLVGQRGGGRGVGGGREVVGRASKRGRDGCQNQPAI